MNDIKNDVQVTFSPDVYLLKLNQKDELIKELQAQLEEVKSGYSKPKKPKREKITPLNNIYSDFKSDGKRKAHAADPIRSYEDFKAIQDYFMSRGDVRDWAMWTIGVCLGLRVSDLLSLKFKHVMEDDRVTIRPRIMIYERKTGKLNNLLITEAVRDALEALLASIKYQFDIDDFIFSSRKTRSKMCEEHGWRILSNAGKALDLPINIGSHTMRKSFANIAACVDKSCVDMNAITKVQGLLNHSDQKVTMRYLATYQDMYDRARVAVSDFALGRTGINEIIAGNQHTVDDVMARIEALESLLGNFSKD